MTGDVVVRVRVKRHSINILAFTRDYPTENNALVGHLAVHLPHSHDEVAAAIRHARLGREKQLVSILEDSGFKNIVEDNGTLSPDWDEQLTTYFRHLNFRPGYREKARRQYEAQFHNDITP